MDYLLMINDRFEMENGQMIGGVVVAHCTVCNESLSTRREVLEDDYGNYYCCDACLEEDLIANGIDTDYVDIKKVVLCL